MSCKDSAIPMWSEELEQRGFGLFVPRHLRNFGKRELNPDFHVSGWLPKLVLFLENQYFGDTQPVLSTVDGFSARIIISVSCFRSFSRSLLGKTHPETG